MSTDNNDSASGDDARGNMRQSVNPTVTGWVTWVPPITRTVLFIWFSSHQLVIWFYYTFIVFSYALFFFLLLWLKKLSIIKQGNWVIFRLSFFQSPPKKTTPPSYKSLLKKKEEKYVFFFVFFFSPSFLVSIIKTTSNSYVNHLVLCSICRFHHYQCCDIRYTTSFFFLFFYL